MYLKLYFKKSNLINIIIKHPDEICTLIGLCPKEVKPKADPTCVMCEFVISLLTKRINPNSTKVKLASFFFLI